MHREFQADCQNRVLANELASTVKLVDNTSNLVRNAELAKVKPAKAASLRDGRYIPFRTRLLAVAPVNGR